MNRKRTADPAAALSLADDNRLMVSGTLDFETVPELMRQLPQMIKAMEKPVVDLSGVTSCNSASIAFILEINRIMKEQNKAVRFEALPDAVATFARAYDAGEVLSRAGILNARSLKAGTA